LSKPGFTSPIDLTIINGTQPPFNALLAQDDYVYFGSDGVISRVSLSTPAKPEPVANFKGAVVAMAFVDGALYWLDSGSPSNFSGSLKRLAIF
jgi:hypothetical protein